MKSILRTLLICAGGICIGVGAKGKLPPDTGAGLVTFGIILIAMNL